MTSKKVYIFNGKSRAATYGIGTYITQIIDCLKDENIEFGLIYIHAEGDEVTITEKEGYQLISIPTTDFSNPHSRQYYARNIAYLLKKPNIFGHKSYLQEELRKMYYMSFIKLQISAL